MSRGCHPRISTYALPYPGQAHPVNHLTVPHISVAVPRQTPLLWVMNIYPFLTALWNSFLFILVQPWLKLKPQIVLLTVPKESNLEQCFSIPATFRYADFNSQNPPASRLENSRELKPTHLKSC